jgi:hypothetical protein
MLLRSQARQSALAVVLTAVLGTGPALAADTGNGSKNFSVPASVPNYFSNEAGPMLGPASETRRGDLYSSQTAQAPQAAAPVAAAPYRERQHVAMAEPRGRVIRGRRGAPIVAHHVAVHGRAVTRVVAQGSSRGRSTHVAVSSGRTTSRTTRVSSSHRHARG